MTFMMIQKQGLDIDTKGRLARAIMNVEENQRLRESDWWDLDMVLLMARVLEEVVGEPYTVEGEIPRNTQTLLNSK